MVIDAGVDDASPRGPSIDASSRTYVDPDWSRVVATDVRSLYGVAALDTGVAVWAKPTSFIYSNSGELAATLPWPDELSVAGQGVQRASGDLAALFATKAGPPVLRQFDTSDFSETVPQKELPLLSGVALGEVDGTLYAVIQLEDSYAYELLRFEPGGVEHTPLELTEPLMLGRRAVRLTGGRVGVCAIRPEGFDRGVPILLGISPATGSVTTTAVDELNEATALFTPGCDLRPRTLGPFVAWAAAGIHAVGAVAAPDATKLLAGPTEGARLRGTIGMAAPVDDAYVGLDFLGDSATLWRFAADGVPRGSVFVRLELAPGDYLDHAAIDGNGSAAYVALLYEQAIGTRLELLRIVTLP